MRPLCPPRWPCESPPSSRTVPWSALLVVAMTVPSPGGPIDHAGTLRAATSVLSGLDLGWVVLAGVAAAATWIFSGVSQQGALSSSLPFGRLLATQFAGHVRQPVHPCRARRRCGQRALPASPGHHLRRGGCRPSDSPSSPASSSTCRCSSLSSRLTRRSPTAFLAGHVPLWLRLVVAAVVLSAAVIVAVRREWVVGRLPGPVVADASQPLPTCVDRAGLPSWCWVLLV